MSFSDSITSVLRQYAVFSGRARRSEFWWFFLFQFLVSLAASIVDATIGTDDLLGNSGWGLLQILVFLTLFLPGLAVGARRLHDTDRSGWWLLIGIIPFVGFIVLLVFFALDPTPGPNRYGPSVKSPPLTPPAQPGYAQP